VSATVDIGGRDVRLTTLDRPLWPELGVTKRHVIDYYATVAPVLLPHLAGRPATLHRFPSGVDGPHFFQTRCPPHPPWIRTQRMWTFPSGKDVDAPVIDDLAGLVWAANLATIEFHPFLSPVEDMTHPTAVVFDLDPGPPAGLVDASRVALWVKELLDALGLVSFSKVSGQLGMHVYVPVHGATYDETKAFARAVAGLLVEHHPSEVTDKMARNLRPGKVFIDWSQNDAGKSTVTPYSMRAGSYPTVAMPVTWQEVADALATESDEKLRFTPRHALRRIEAHGDLLAPSLDVVQCVPLAQVDR
jgi:bifunctional non-homologous end joining protein LigD